MQISKQHAALANILENTKTHVFITMGARSTGKSYDSSIFVLSKMYQNITNYEITKKNDHLKKIMLMRQNSSDIKDSVYSTFLNSYYTDLEDKEYLMTKNIKVLDDNIQYINEDISNARNKVVLCRGFKSSNKQNTARQKSILGINCYLIEEAEEVLESDFEQLYMTALRENAQIIIVLNSPHKDHWIVKKYFNLTTYEHEENYFVPTLKPFNNVTYIKSTLEGNAMLDKETKDQYKELSDSSSSHYNIRKYYTDVLGLVPAKAEGRVFNDYSICSLEEYNNVLKQELLGLDFGFSNDPTSLMGVKKYGKKLYIDQKVYSTGLLTSKLISELKRLEITPFKMIKYDVGGGGDREAANLTEAGFYMEAAKKGAGSIIAGINEMNEFELIVTDRSDKVMEELQNYVYKKDKNGNKSNEPIDDYNHAIDAIRYAIESTERTLTVF